MSQKRSGLKVVYLHLKLKKHDFFGAFRDALRATTVDKHIAQTTWVVKQYQEEASNTIKDDLGMSLEDHTRKQLQMSAVARHLTNRGQFLCWQPFLYCN